MSAAVQESKKQELFRVMFVGTLLYTVVLGFFDDYTDLLRISSFSIVFAAAFVLQVLTYATFAFKGRVKRGFGVRDTKLLKIGFVLSIWFILFSSKFVFLAVLDLFFGNSVEFSGFFSLMLVVVCLTVAHRLAGFAYEKLAD